MEIRLLFGICPLLNASQCLTYAAWCISMLQVEAYVKICQN